MQKAIFIIFFLFCIKTFVFCFDCDSFNRKIYSFNRGFERILVNPSLNFYFDILPVNIKLNINNFFHMFESTQYFFILFLNNNFKFCLEYGFFLFNGLAMSSLSFLNFNVVGSVFYFDDYRVLVNQSLYFFCPFIGPGFLGNYIFIFSIQFLNLFLYFYNEFLLYYFFYIINKKSYLNYDLNFFHSIVLDGYSFLKDIYFQTKIFIK